LPPRHRSEAELPSSAGPPHPASPDERQVVVHVRAPSGEKRKIICERCATVEKANFTSIWKMTRALPADPR